VADSLTVSVLQATLESTADGILVVDLDGNIVSHNRRFEEIWNLPTGMVAANTDAAGRRRLIQHVQDQLVKSQFFVDGIQERYTEPKSDSFDILNFKDGRVLERSSIPLRRDGRSVGRGGASAT
jgi:PAS domain S-box-containing protein